MKLMSSAVLDRAALYYPYIHIEPDKIDWLKATLLCFPQIRRTIPAGFDPNDAPEIWEFQREKNANGEVLFDSEYLDMSSESSAPKRAQERLLRKLRQLEQQIIERFSKWEIRTVNLIKSTVERCTQAFGNTYGKTN